MTSPYAVCHVVVATVPLYVAMSLAYASVKWWKIFKPEQCAGIKKFVAKFSVPLLSFQVISILLHYLPQGIVPFMFAKEDDVHPNILSTGVIFGMVIALPIRLVYYSLLAS